ncbi:MAG: response regulator transcription factor [Firmicutes bacterium]|nr:response regulator transcription factor [Bacillota bacterium]
MRILIVEDEPNLNNVIAKRLKKEGYSVDSAYDGETALEYINTVEYNAIVMDLMIPHKNGLEVIREMRSKGNKTPVLVLTARDSIHDRVAGLDAGADDYLVKPFAFDEFLARVRALFRRNTGFTSNVMTAGDLEVDLNRHVVTRAGKQIQLSTKEFTILEYLMRNKNVVLSREQIEQNAWDLSFDGGSNIVDVYIRYLRKKIDSGFDKKLIHTVYGAGYILKEE